MDIEKLSGISSNYRRVRENGKLRREQGMEGDGARDIERD